MSALRKECGSHMQSGPSRYSVLVGDTFGDRKPTEDVNYNHEFVALTSMFEPIRGGTRGGQAEFKWTDVSADKDREHYLGHSINAPTGRWQKNKDVHWYSRDTADGEAERAEEIRKIKEAEAEALSVALGFGPTRANVTQPGAESSTTAAPSTEDNTTRKQEKEERRRRKAERKEEKHARKAARVANRDEQDVQMRHRSRSRSLSPTHRRRGDQRERRSRSPTRDHEDRRNRQRDYGESEREKEREKHRRLWDMNAVRDKPRYRDN